MVYFKIIGTTSAELVRCASKLNITLASVSISTKGGEVCVCSEDFIRKMFSSNNHSAIYNDDGILTSAYGGLVKGDGYSDCHNEMHIYS